MRQQAPPSPGGEGRDEGERHFGSQPSTPNHELFSSGLKRPQAAHPKKGREKLLLSPNTPPSSILGAGSACARRKNLSGPRRYQAVPSGTSRYEAVRPATFAHCNCRRRGDEYLTFPLATEPDAPGPLPVRKD